jgi:hypothetical protein
LRGRTRDPFSTREEVERSMTYDDSALVQPGLRALKVTSARMLMGGIGGENHVIKLSRAAKFSLVAGWGGG